MNVFDMMDIVGHVEEYRTMLHSRIPIVFSDFTTPSWEFLPKTLLWEYC